MLPQQIQRWVYEAGSIKWWHFVKHAFKCCTTVQVSEADPENLHRGANLIWGTFTRCAAGRSQSPLSVGAPPDNRGGYGPLGPPGKSAPGSVLRIIQSICWAMPTIHWEGYHHKSSSLYLIIIEYSRPLISDSAPGVILVFPVSCNLQGFQLRISCVINPMEFSIKANWWIDTTSWCVEICKHLAKEWWVDSHWPDHNVSS